MMTWREVGPYLRELWHRPAGPMNWKNPILVFAVAGWLVLQGLMLLGWTVFRVVHFVVRLPALLLFFFGGVWYAVWSFVRRPFPSLDEHPILALVQFHTPDFFSFMVLWYYLSPFVAVMLCGVISVTVWKVWLEGRRRDFAPFAKLPPWPLDPKQKAPAIVIGEVHHPVEAREIFSPSWLTIPERGLYTGVAIFGAVGSGKTSACMNPFARQLLGWQAGDPQMRAAALVDLLRQSVYSRLAGYEDLNDAVRVSADPTFRLLGSKKNWDRGGALTSRLQSFETGLLASEENLLGWMAVNRELVAQAEGCGESERVVLDMDSTESPVHGQQEGSAYNGHFESVCYHPLLLFNQHGDCLAAKLRAGNVSSAEDWDELLLPEIERQHGEGKRVTFRADAAYGLWPRGSGTGM